MNPEQSLRLDKGTSHFISRSHLQLLQLQQDEWQPSCLFHPYGLSLYDPFLYDPYHGPFHPKKNVSTTNHWKRKVKHETHLRLAGGKLGGGSIRRWSGSFLVDMGVKGLVAVPMVTFVSVMRLL